LSFVLFAVVLLYWAAKNVQRMFSRELKGRQLADSFEFKKILIILFFVCVILAFFISALGKSLPMKDIEKARKLKRH
jgi:uncharacterized membrane protein YidH (DUF202 family)